jgi:hypothetical protein
VAACLLRKSGKSVHFGTKRCPRRHSFHNQLLLVPLERRESKPLLLRLEGFWMAADEQAPGALHEPLVGQDSAVKAYKIRKQDRKSRTGH